MLNYVFNDDFMELALNPDLSFQDAILENKSGVLHCPWWKFYCTDPSKVDVKADMVVINHALCEMNHYAMFFVSSLHSKRWQNLIVQDCCLWKARVQTY